MPRTDSTRLVGRRVPGKTAGSECVCGYIEPPKNWKPVLSHQRGFTGCLAIHVAPTSKFFICKVVTVSFWQNRMRLPQSVSQSNFGLRGKQSCPVCSFAVRQHPQPHPSGAGGPWGFHSLLITNGATSQETASVTAVPLLGAGSLDLEYKNLVPFFAPPRTPIFCNIV